MDGYINLLGVTISLANAGEAMEKTQGFLDDKGRHVIRFVDTKACTLASEDADCAKLIAESDFVLPADFSTEQGVKELVEGYREMFWHQEYFDMLFNNASENALEVYFVTPTVQRYTDIADTIHAQFPYLSIHGKALEEFDLASSYDALANDINAVAPDILFFYVDVKMQNTLLTECSDIINASLLICGIGMFEDAIDEQKAPVEEDAPLKEKFWHRMINFFKRIHTTIKGMIFKNRVKSSRKDDSDGDEE